MHYTQYDQLILGQHNNEEYILAHDSHRPYEDCSCWSAVEAALRTNHAHGGQRSDLKRKLGGTAASTMEIVYLLFSSRHLCSRRTS